MVKVVCIIINKSKFKEEPKNNIPQAAIMKVNHKVRSSKVKVASKIHLTNF